MKRIIAAALAILLGSAGYVIVDHTIEDRVAVLEQQMQSVCCDVSSLDSNSQKENTAPAKAVFYMKLPEFGDYSDIVNIYTVKSTNPNQKNYQHSDWMNGEETPLTLSATNGEKYELSIYLNQALYCRINVENQNDIIYVSNVEYFDFHPQDLTTTTTTLPNAVIK